MKTIWNDADLRALQNRLHSLNADTGARWGKMNAPQMMAHLADALRMALGDLACQSKRVPLRYPPLKQLVIYWLPWPEGAPTAPELIRRAPVSWPGEVADVVSLLERIARQPREIPFAEHPAFGRLSRRAWGVLVYRHTDHHLRQFGV